MKAQVRARWERAILICAKCEKKLKGGFGADGKAKLSKCLARRNGGGRGRKARLGVVATPCLKICPKGAVTVVDADRPGEWLIVADGTPLAEVEARLGLAGDTRERTPPAAAQSGSRPA